MKFTKEIRYNDGLDKYRLTPQQVYDQSVERGADAVYAF